VRQGHDESLITGPLIHQVIDATAERVPDNVAIVDAHRTWTYGQLKDESDLLARLLQSRGVCAGQCVGMYLPHCAEYIIANLAIFKAGASMLLLEISYPAALLAELTDMASVSFVLSQAALSPTLPPAFHSEARSLNLDGDWALKLAQVSRHFPLQMGAPACKIHSLYMELI
jgi:non-ribosomal peptide synthetase component F